MKLRRLILRAVFELLACALYYTGVLFIVGWIRKRTGRRRLVITMYHHLARPVPAHQVIHQIERGMAPRHFAGHLRVYRWFGDVVPLEDSYDELTRPTRRSRTVIALTFDDGYLDNLTVGLPALQERRMPAACFPAIDAMGAGRLLWWDKVIRAVRHAPGNGAIDVSRLRGLDGAASAAAQVAGANKCVPREALAEHLIEWLATKPVSQRNRLLDELQHRLCNGSAPTGDPHLYVTWNELRRMAHGGIAVGGHTVRHPCLTAERPEVAELEITECRRILQNELGRPVTTFSYPGGYHDMRVRDMVDRAGYRVAVTVQRGVNHVGDDPLRLKRLGLSWEAPRHLALKLAICDFIYR